MKKAGPLSIPFFVLALIFIVAPLLLIVFYSFTKQETGGFQLTIENFKRFFDFSNPVYMENVVRSVWLALISTVFCLVLGYPVAYILAGLSENARRIVSFLFILPMWMNMLLRTYAWVTILGNAGIINTIFKSIGLPTVQLMYNEQAIVLGNVYNFLPFMILPIFNTILKLDKSVLEASRDLGANGIKTFARVIFPLTLPAVVSGITMTFLPAVTTFIVSRLLGGGISLIGDVIESQFLTFSNWGFGSALSVVIMTFILLCMGVLSKYEKEQTEGGQLL